MKKMTLSQLLEAYFVGNKKAQEELMKRCFTFVRGKIFANECVRHTQSIRCARRHASTTFEV